MNQEATLPQRWAALVMALCAALAAANPRVGALGELYVRVITRVHNTIKRFNRLHALWLEGKLPTPKPRAKRERTPRESNPIPQGHNWIEQYVVFPPRYELWSLLETPDLRQFAAEVPAIARMLRPICKMMGLEPLPTPPPVPRAKREVKPRPKREWPKRPQPPDICLAIHGMPREQFYEWTRRWRFRRQWRFPEL
jgi:hypothetical protein